MTTQRRETLTGTAIAAAAFVLYAVTLCPTVDFIDAGELATDAFTLGIAHPTGYPLFTLLASIASKIPLPFRVITRLNLLSAVFCASALYVYFRLFLQLLDAAGNGGRTDPGGGGGMPAARLAGAACATIILATSETYWSQALSIEVYPLHLLLVGIVLLLFVRAAGFGGGGGSGRGRTPEREAGDERLWLLFAFVLGLSFTNHMTTILLAPGCLYLFFARYRHSREGLRLLGRLVIPFLAGLSLYLYLPLRAGVSPLMNWGNPIDADRFLTHVSGKVYRVWIFSSGETAARQFAYFLKTLPGEFAVVPLIPALIGASSLLRGNRRMFIFTALLFLGCLLYAINYDINDIDSYFLLAYITIACWAAFGIRKIILLAGRGRPAAAAVAVCLAASLPGLPANYAGVDESDNRIVEAYTRDMLAPVADDGIIISSQWDYFVSASLYLQTVERLRPDVVVIDKELMRRSWYYPELAQRHPWLIRGSQKEVDAFLPELDKFEHDRPYNPSVIEYRYGALIRSFISRNLASRAVYVTQEVGQQYLAPFRMVPWGLAFRLFPDSLGEKTGPEVQYDVQIPARRDKYVQGIVSLYAAALYNNGAAAAGAGDSVKAARYAEASLRIEPSFRQAAELKARLSGAPGRE